jgi:FMN phosphatase YigB (HAD superfamily)
MSIASPTRKRSTAVPSLDSPISLHCGVLLFDLDGVLVCADEIQRGKPDPEGYLTASKRLGIDPASCVVIEDTPLGLEAARAAGIRSIAVCGTYDRMLSQSRTTRFQILQR